MTGRLFVQTLGRDAVWFIDALGGDLERFAHLLGRVGASVLTAGQHYHLRRSLEQREPRQDGLIHLLP